MKKLIFYILSGLLLFAGCTPTTEGYKSNEVLVVSHDTINANSSAVSVTINVNSLVPYEIETTEAWITPSKKSGERGISEFRLDIAKNQSFEGRTATVSIINVMYGLSHDITILQEKAVPSNTIYYTSSNGRVVTPFNEDAFGANIVSNTYNNGEGAILFDEPVMYIGYAAFYDCSSLTSMTFPESVTEIGMNAFSGCSSLTSVTIDNSVTSIGEQAFIECTSLTSVTIPDSVTEIGEGAFAYCSSLTSVTIGNSVTSIGKQAFAECSGKLIINSNIIGISHSSTENITQSYEHWLYGSKFKDVTIGGKAEQVGEYAFYYYESLENVEIAEGVKAIRSVAFQGCSSLKNITLLDGVTKIWDSAFRECSSLKSITIPNSVTEIGERAFCICNSLTSVTIGDSVTSIGKDAFRECSSLTSITIPDNVTSIGRAAFDVCSSLTSVYCKPTTPPAGGQYMFDQSASGRKIYVPHNSVSAYKAKQYWSDYASDIVGYDFENGTEIPEGGGNEGGVFTLNGSDLDNIGSTYTTTMESFTATDGSVWKILGYCKSETDIIQFGAKNNNYILTPATTNGINTIKLTCSGNYYVALWDPLTNQLISGMVAEPSVANYDGNGTITFTLPAGYKQVKIISTRNADGTDITSKNAATYIKKIVVTSK